MNDTVTIIITILLFAVMEAAWLWFSRPFYAGQFANFTKDGKLEIRCKTAVALVYPLMILGFWVLVLKENSKDKANIGKAFIRGAVFGATVYGVYNLTNKATLPGYSWKMTAVDTAWGATVFGVASLLHAWMV